jgi:hypothetical protein
VFGCQLSVSQMAQDITSWMVLPRGQELHLSHIPKPCLALSRFSINICGKNEPRGSLLLTQTQFSWMAVEWMNDEWMNDEWMNDEWMNESTEATVTSTLPCRFWQLTEGLQPGTGGVRISFLDLCFGASLWFWIWAQSGQMRGKE